MTYSGVSFRALAALLALSAAAQAQTAQRVLVSAAGTDNATCGTPTAPCRSFQQAHTRVIAGGEIIAVDKGNFGPVTITKSVTISRNFPGKAMIVSTGPSAVAINAGASDRIVLRGLALEYVGDPANNADGILMNSGGALVVDQCLIRGFTQRGVGLNANTPTAYTITRSQILNNSNVAGLELQMNAGAGATSLTMEEDVVANTVSGDGVSITSNATSGVGQVTITDSVFANNAFSGLFATSPTLNSPLNVSVRESVSVNNGFNGFTLGSSLNTLRLGGNVATNNNNGVRITGGATAQTYGDNALLGNVSENVSGALTFLGNQ